MLLRCIKAEKQKLKGSFIWLAFLIVPVLPAVMGTGNYNMNTEILTKEWYSLWTQITLFYSNFFYGPLIAIYCSYLWRLEHLHYNWNHCMTAPVPVSCLFMAKWVQAFKMALFTQVWMSVLFVICGRIVGFTGFPPAAMAVWMARGLIGGCGTAALQLLLSMKIRSFALPVAIALGGSIAGFLAVNTGLGLLCPYSLMMLGMNANRDTDMLGGSLLPFLLSCAVFLALFCWIGIWMLRRQDVRAA